MPLFDLVLAKTPAFRDFKDPRASRWCQMPGLLERNQQFLPES